MYPSHRYEIRVGSNKDNTKVSAGYDPTPYQFSTSIQRKGMILLILLKYQKQVLGWQFHYSILQAIIDDDPYYARIK